MKLLKYVSYSLLLLMMGSCSKDDAKPGADIYYTVSINDKTVTFTNETKGATSYKWDFGDGESSTEASPVHTYPDKGKYVPTLYATTSGGQVSEGSTVIYIAKTSPVKLNDNSLADWDNVNEYVFTAAAAEPFFKKMKVDYDAQYIYLYFETAAPAGDIYDIYLDTDNDAGTGYTMDVTGAGFDVLLEGAQLDAWMDVFNHSGPQNGFGFSPTGAGEFFLVGHKATVGGNYAHEMRLTRSKLKNMAATQAFRIAVIANKSDWSAARGRIPASGAAAFQINFE